MARTLFTVTEIVRGGTAVPVQQSGDPVNNHYVASTDADETWWFEAYNSSATARVVSVVANPNLQADGLSISNYSCTVGVGATVVAGPFRYNTFRQPNDSNKVYVNLDAGSLADVKFRLFKITPAS